MANAHVISWSNPTQYVDGTAYTQADNAGYTIALDGTGDVSIPLAFGTSFDLSTLAAYQALKQGTHTVALAVVSAGGVQSAFSNAVSFQVNIAPDAPTNLAIS